MSYTSSIYLVFLIITCGVYYLISAKHRWLVLLLANLIFYVSSGWDNLIFILSSIIITYFITLKIGRLHEEFAEKKNTGNLEKAEIKKLKEEYGKIRKKYLIIGLVLVLAFLVVVKYTNFILGNVYSILNLIGVKQDPMFVNMVVPMGISFYTFQIISYIMDVYKAKITPQKNFLRFSLYISFFPSVVQGPIPRYSDLGKQLNEEHKFQFENLRDGALLILWGFAKKLILAERLVILVDEVYSNYMSYGGVILMLATAAFSIQIYADFSSCMDIASGSAKLFGITLTKNFLRPYFSKNMPEFWRRWHVTLGSWFKDYVFYPFSISKFALKLNKNARNTFGSEIGRIISSSLPILLVWSLTGIWHGPEWKYVAWGLFHGCLIMSSMIFSPYIEKFVEKVHMRTDCFSFRLFQMLRTFFLCCVGRVFFRADSLTDALLMFKRMITTTGAWQLWDHAFWEATLNSANLMIVVVAMLILWIVSMLEEKMDVWETLSKQNLIFRWIIIYALFFAVVVFGKYGPGYDSAAFIYEQF